MANQPNSFVCILVTCLATLVTAIRVDWNTNHGPIVPPTPRTTVRPQPPYREPAPVWEDQSRDLPNPYPYVYILPPPSRPRAATNNYLTAANYNAESYYARLNNNNNYGQLVPPAAVNSYYQQQQQQSGYPNNVVAALSPKYIPNQGIQYTAVVPAQQAAAKSQFAKSANNLSPGYYNLATNSNDKPQGKFNAKTKKYKAYEKSKYQPLNYYPMFDLPMALPNGEQQQQYVPEFDPSQLLGLQQLPMAAAPQEFRQTNVNDSTTSTSTTTAKPFKLNNELQAQKFKMESKLHGIKSSGHKYNEKLMKKHQHYDAKAKIWSAPTPSSSTLSASSSSPSSPSPSSSAPTSITTTTQNAPKSANSIFS